MIGVNDILVNGENTNLKHIIWLNAEIVFKEQIRVETNLKSQYSTLREQNGLTGIGGVSPDTNFPFYNEVGQACATGRGMHPNVLLESEQNDESGPSVYIRQESDDELSTRIPINLSRLSMSTIKDDIIDPSRMYRVLNMALRNQLREELNTTTTAAATTTTTVPTAETTNSTTATPAARYTQRTQQQSPPDESEVREQQLTATLESSTLRSNELAFQRQSLFFEKMNEITDRLHQKRRADFEEMREIRKRDRLDYENRMFERMLSLFNLRNQQETVDTRIL
ncbi:unnamed protein product [Mucor hiemalis]